MPEWMKALTANRPALIMLAAGLIALCFLVFGG